MKRAAKGVDTGFERGTKAVRQGFTLLEILVAVTILVIIVLLMAQMFHQASIAWDSGVRRADVNMEARAVLSAMAQEISQAVGDDILTLNMQDGSDIEFYMLKSASTSNRVVERIRYRRAAFALTRSVTLVDPGTAYPTPQGAVQESTLLDNCVNLEFNVPSSFSSSTNLPLWLDVSLGVKRDAGAIAVDVTSCGPDRTLGTGDDVSASDDR